VAVFRLDADGHDDWAANVDWAALALFGAAMAQQMFVFLYWYPRKYRKSVQRVLRDTAPPALPAAVKGSLFRWVHSAVSRRSSGRQQLDRAASRGKEAGVLEAWGPVDQA